MPSTCWPANHATTTTDHLAPSHHVYELSLTSPPLSVPSPSQSKAWTTAKPLRLVQLCHAENAPERHARHACTHRPSTAARVHRSAPWEHARHARSPPNAPQPPLAVETAASTAQSARTARPHKRRKLVNKTVMLVMIIDHQICVLEC